MRRAISVLFVVLALFAAGAMVLQAGSVPHRHDGKAAGLYNQEHDLTLLAGLSGHGLPADAEPGLTSDTVSPFVSPSAPERPPVRLARSGDSRAPPTA